MYFPLLPFLKIFLCHCIIANIYVTIIFQFGSSRSIFPESLGLHFNYKAMDGGDHGLCNPHQCESKKANISGLGMLSFFCMETLTPGFTQIMSQLCHLIVV